MNTEKAFGALADTLASVDSHAPTACAGWSRALPPKKLRRTFFAQALRATVAVERLAAADDGRRQVMFTGVALDAPTLILHIESELVLHRWDIVGSDAIGIAALSDSRLAEHALTTVAAMQPSVFGPGGPVTNVTHRSPADRTLLYGDAARTRAGPLELDP